MCFQELFFWQSKKHYHHIKHVDGDVNYLFRGVHTKPQTSYNLKQIVALMQFLFFILSSPFLYNKEEDNTIKCLKHALSDSG